MRAKCRGSDSSSHRPGLALCRCRKCWSSGSPQQASQTAFKSVYLSKACRDLSRPEPDCLKPLKGDAIDPRPKQFTQNTTDRRHVGRGQSVSERVSLGGRHVINKKITIKNQHK